MDEITASDVLIAGLPGARMAWVCDLVARAMNQRYGSVAAVSIDAGALREVADSSAPRLFIGHCIDGEWAVSIRAGLIPTVLVIEDIAASWHHLSRHSHDPYGAARDLTVVAHSLGDLVGQGGVLTLGQEAWRGPEAPIAAILGHLDLADQAMSMGELGNPRPSVGPIPDEIPPDIAEILTATLSPAHRYASEGTRTPVIWPRVALLWGDRPGEQLPRVLDMTGPARVVAYGPYYRLPPGRWIMRATLVFSPDCKGMPLALELHGPTELGRFPFIVELPGIFAASMPVVVPSPRETLEFRLTIERGAIEGRLGIDRIEFLPEP